MFTVIVAAIGFVIGATVLCYIQARALVHPPRLAVSAQAQIAGSDPVSFVTSDGLTLHGWYRPPAGGAAILFVHGHGGNRTHFQREADLYADMGYGVLLFDLRNHGESDGDVTSMGRLEVRDVEAAHAFLSSQPAVDRIALYGHSMGGTSAILAAARLPDVRALVVDTAYTSLVELAGDGVNRVTGLPGFPWGNLIAWFTGYLSDSDASAIRPIDVIAGVEPVLFLHGTDDPVIQVHHGEDLFAAAEEPKALYIVPGGEHGGLYAHDPATYEATVPGFLAEHLSEDQA